MADPNEGALAAGSRKGPGLPRGGLPDSARRRLFVAMSRYREASIAVVALLLVVYFQFGSDGGFITPQFLSVVLRETGRLGLIAAAEVMLMITGEIDLSVSGTFSLAPYLMALMAVGWGVPLWLGALAGISIGVLVGWFNGIVSVRFRVPSLITTVGTLFLLQGIVVSIYNSQPIVAPVQEPFNAIFGESLFEPNDNLFSWHGVTAFTPFLWAALVIAALALALNRTTFGLHTIATGSNITGARDRRAHRPDQDSELHDRGRLCGLRRYHQYRPVRLGRPAGRQSESDASGDRRRGHRGHVAARRLRHRRGRPHRRLRRRDARQRPRHGGSPGDGVGHLSRRRDHRRHGFERSGRPAPHPERQMTDPVVPLAPDAPVVLEMSHIAKSFGPVTALVDVSVKLRHGEVLALVGDNGAGKSTLIKILSGFHRPDSGTVSLKGAEVHFASPRDARAHGIETVYQDLAMIGDLSVYHNMFLGREYHKRMFGLNLLDNRKMRDLARTYLDTLGIGIPDGERHGRPALRGAAPVHRGRAIDLCLAEDPRARRTAGGARRPRERPRSRAVAEPPTQARRLCDPHRP